jgi:cytosine/adenosine deaminase-related metal-dependent hydrolase
MRIGIEGRLIVAYDGKEHRLLQNGIIVYENNTIIHVGKSFSGALDKKITAPNRLIIPGLICLHSHMVGAPFERGFRGDRSGRTFFDSDLYDRGGPFSTSKTPTDNRVAFQYSLSEMLRGGVTTILELGAVDALAEEAVDLAGQAGIRAYLPQGHLSGAWYSPDGRNVSYDNFDGEQWIEEPGFQALEHAERFIEKHNGSFDDRVRAVLYPVQVDTCSAALLKETRKVADERNLLITSHLCQSVHEFREMMRRYGMTAIEYLHKIGVLGSDFIAAHTIMPAGHSRVGLADPLNSELHTIAESGTTVVHCPHPFARYGIAMESYGKYLRKGINVGLGLDTWPYDMFREMKLAAILSKVVEASPMVATAKDLLNSATLSGARALHRPDLGRIAKGAKADLVLIRLDSFNLCPVTDPIYLLVHAATREDVDMVIVDGQIVVEEGRVTGFNQKEIFKEIQKASDALRQRVPEKDRAHRTADQINPPTLKEWT